MERLRKVLGYGEPDIRIGIIDGAIDVNHPTLADSNITIIANGSAPVCSGFPCAHGTHVASMIFGQPGTEVEGLAPRCHGVTVPVFEETQSGVQSLSQIDLGRALISAAEQGASIINVSAGIRASTARPHPLLERAVRHCLSRSILIVAATGNDGEDCITIPAALPGVMAVAAIDGGGRPLSSNNWGKAFEGHGLMAVGSDRAGAIPNGGIARRSGTSFACPIVSGVAALLLGFCRGLGISARPYQLIELLLKTAAIRWAAQGDGAYFSYACLDPSNAVRCIEQGGL